MKKKGNEFHQGNDIFWIETIEQFVSNITAIIPCVLMYWLGIYIQFTFMETNDWIYGLMKGCGNSTANGLELDILLNKYCENGDETWLYRAGDS